MVDHIAARPGPKALQAAVKHVAHDVTRLGQAYSVHDNVFAWTAWYVFCRSVMDFFDPQSPYADDILAEHYFQRPETWRAVVGAASRPLAYSDFRMATNKLAAHLTYARIRYEGDPKWSPSLEITTYLLELATSFLEHLPADRGAWFEAAGIQCEIPETPSAVEPDSPEEADDQSLAAEEVTELVDVSAEDAMERLAEALVTRVPALRDLAELREASNIAEGPVGTLSFNLNELVSAEQLERAYVMHVLAESDGNKTRTADILGMDQSTLYRKLNRWGVS